MNNDVSRPSRRRQWAGRIGPFWYAIPGLFVVLAGLATCSLIDVTDFDRFDIEASVADRSGVRSAAIVRHWHADSAATVKCVWILPGPPPRPGPSHRLAPSCALVATDAAMPLALRWQTTGRLLVAVPAAATALKSDESHSRCYFEAEQLPQHICYRTELLDIERMP